MLNIDEAIKAFLFDYSSAIEQDDFETVIPATKALLREVLAEITPSRAPVREEDDLDRGINIGQNVAIDELEEKVKELLG